MPDTLLSLAVLILLLVPGVVFVIQVDNRRPTRDLSALRELVSIAAVGALCDFTVLVIFGILRAFLPAQTPNVGSIAQFGFSYIKFHLVSDSVWLAGMLVASCLLAYILGRFWPGVAGAVAAGHITFTSAWWELFRANPDSKIYVGCQLQDDSYIAGYLWRYSTETDETADRELALTAPITYSLAGSPDSRRTLENVGAVSIKASQMKFLTVSYLPLDENSV
jgi:Family of unknown function (DUF6338)